MDGKRKVLLAGALFEDVALLGAVHLKSSFGVIEEKEFEFGKRWVDEDEGSFAIGAIVRAEPKAELRAARGRRGGPWAGVALVGRTGYKGGESTTPLRAP